MDHVMFENEAGEIECVGCGRRLRIRPFKIMASGDATVTHTFSSHPGFQIEGVLPHQAN